MHVGAPAEVLRTMDLGILDGVRFRSALFGCESVGYQNSDILLNPMANRVHRKF
jgi:hypothetical protein